MPNLILVGFMGTGKTTVGHRLAARLSWRFFDLDREIEAATNCSIPQLFSQGEMGFRQIEAAQLQKSLAFDKSILSTGGGVVELEENRRLLRQAKEQQGAIVVWLMASLKEIIKRIPTDANRPLLNRGTISQLMLRREPLYAEVANIKVNTDNMSINSVVEQILADVGF